MILRQPTREEYSEMVRIRDLSFLNPRSTDERPAYTPEAGMRARCAFDDAGIMAASLDLWDFSCSFDGQTVRMGGIGGVSTLVEARRNGYVRGLLTHVLREMYDEGYAFSALYPFSHRFYRKFGYELCPAKVTATFPVDAIPCRAATGFLTQHRPEQSLEDVEAVYEAFTKDANFVIQRAPFAWKRWAQNPAAYAYRWHGPDGKTRAYVLYSLHRESEDNVLAVEDMAWLDAEALAGLLGLFRALDSSYRRVKMRVPAWVDPFRLVEEPYEVSLRTTPSGMLRVVDVAGALQRMRRPERIARFTLGVTDPVLPENNGVFRVVLDGAEAEVIKESKAAPDMTTDIQTLTQLICGSHTPAQLLQSGANLTVKDNLETLSRVFTTRPIHMVEGF